MSDEWEATERMRARIRAIIEAAEKCDYVVGDDGGSYPEIHFDPEQAAREIAGIVLGLVRTCERLQWGGVDVNERPICPECSGDEAAGHAEDCPVAAAIRAAWSQPSPA